MKPYTSPHLTDMEQVTFETVCAASGRGTCLTQPGRNSVKPGQDDCQHCMISHGLIAAGANHGQNAKAIRQYLQTGQLCPGGLTLSAKG